MSTENIPILYIDRTGGETDDACGMRYFWNRKYGALGIVAKERASYFKIGATTHEDLATVADLDDISAPVIDQLIREITDPITEQDKLIQKTMEVLYRRLGWIAAFALFVEPRIRAEFENVSVEDEIILDRTPLWVAITPDRVLRHRVGGYLIYREYKTALQAGFKWARHWQYDIQIHLGMKALEEELGEKLAYGQVMGLLKGDDRGERLVHPYVWAYRNTKTGDWTHDYTKARSSDWEHAPVWDYPGGVVEWVQKLGEEVALSQFPHSAPCFLDERQVEDWCERKIVRETYVEDNREECQTDASLRNLVFEKRTSQCTPIYGDPCEYLAACWNAAVNENPLASGIYEPRQPHHEVEVVLYRNAQEAINAAKNQGS